MPRKNAATIVRFEWANVAPDPVQYKPYNPELIPDAVYVEVEVPSDYVVSAAKDKTVLTPEGMAYACKQIAKAIFRAHNDQL